MSFQKYCLNEHMNLVTVCFFDTLEVKKICCVNLNVILVLLC